MMNAIPRASRSGKIVRAAVALGLVLPLAFQFPALAASEKHASGADSNETKWSSIVKSRYVDVIRKTDRVAYIDGGTTPPISCDMSADDKADIVLVNAASVNVLPYIPYGSVSDEVVRTLSQQESLLSTAAPSDSTAFGTHAACIRRAESNRHALAVADGTRVRIYAEGTATTSPHLTTTINVGENVIAVSAGPSKGRPVLAIGTPSGVHIVKTAALADGDVDLAELDPRTWQIDGTAGLSITALDSSEGELAIGSPATRSVHIAPIDTAGRRFLRVRRTIQDSANSDFGHALAAVPDLNDDGVPDLAIGAPDANAQTGAVSLVFTPTEGTTTVDSSSTMGDAIVDESEENAGFLLRQALGHRLGASLAWIDGGAEAGALFVGRPNDGEHSGGLVISQKALNQHWNTGQGIDAIPGSQHAVLASQEGADTRSGEGVAVIPRRGEDPLTGLITIDIQGRVDVWTVDMSRQSDPDTNLDSVPTPEVPAPPAPSAEPGLVPVDSTEKKSWLGEFTSGFGGALARGRCDVTGDGRADIVSGNVVRSEWKYDPLYAESTKTKGWVFNVTGQVEIVPGGTPGKIVTSEDTIRINGPKKTHDPAIDAAVGLSVACLGDVNGDHIDDIAFGSHTMARVWVLFGGAHLSDVNLNSLNPAHGWFVDLPSDGSGAFQVSRVGDVDGDGLADLGFVVANAAYAAGRIGESQGSAFIIKGKKDGDVIDLKDVDREDPSIIKRIDTPRDHTMNAFTPVGDVNGDGVGDYVVSDFQHFDAAFRVAGRAWVVFGGGEHRMTAGTAGSGYALTMPFDTSHRLGAGNSIAPLGDIDGDGVGDFVIGFDGGSLIETSPGGVAVVHGAKSTLGEPVEDVVISPRTPAESSSRVSIVTGKRDTAGVGFGYGVDALIRSGQLPLLVIGAQGENDGDGRAYLVSAEQIAPGVHSIDDVEATIVESSGPKARFGRAVAFVGDVLDAPTVAIGGDGVLDESATDTQGYAHTAHVMALRVGPAVAPDTQSPNDDSAGGNSAGDKQEMPGDNAGSPNAQHGKASNPAGERLASTGYSHMLHVFALIVGIGGVSALVIKRWRHQGA